MPAPADDADTVKTPDKDGDAEKDDSDKAKRRGLKKVSTPAGGTLSSIQHNRR